ncbi:MAG: hypothetical protein ACI8WT_002998 [Clostridium sp.]|jgi:hypothetical protein
MMNNVHKVRHTGNFGRNISLLTFKGGIVLNIWIILGITYIVISLTFMSLVEANKIKPSKVSRIFYSDDESFIKSWKKTKEKGILIYTIKNGAMYTAVYGIIEFIITPKDDNSIMYWREHWREDILLLVVTVVFCSLIISLVRWGVEQHRYSKLKEKVENDNTKNV